MRKCVGGRSVLAAAVVLAAGWVGLTPAQRYLDGVIWPEPPVVTPGTAGGPPSDAVVLFDGKNFDAWEGAKGSKINADGSFTAGSAPRTKQSFGDIQLHLEFATPAEVKGDGQGRGNNGVGLMGARYEIQVLDSYKNKTYPEGQCGSVYNQTPPMVNACRKPGEWQTYDIVFTAPRFGKGNEVLKPAYVTVVQNGVVVQNHTEIKGSTHYNQANAYSRHPAKGPLVLMYHGNPVRFRNIWVREIKPLVGKPGGPVGIEGKKPVKDKRK
jgi:hypothetical protein